MNEQKVPSYPIRPVSADFILAMEDGLEHGRKKGRTGWDSRWQSTTFHTTVFEGLLKKLGEEYAEFMYALTFEDPETIRKEGADVANLCMMLVDFCEGWDK